MITMEDYCPSSKVLTTLITFHKFYSLIGDFNVPDINWEDSNYLGSELSLAANFFDAINDAYSFQHVTGFTRLSQKWSEIISSRFGIHFCY